MHFLYKLYVQNNPMLLRDHNASPGDSHESSNLRHASVVRSGRRIHGPISRRVDPRWEDAYGVRGHVPEGYTTPQMRRAFGLRYRIDGCKFCGPPCHWSGPNHHCSRLRWRPRADGRPRLARLHVVRLGKPAQKVEFTPNAVIAPAEAGYESENTRHARHYFRRSNGCFLSDFHRVCEVLRSHSLR